MLKKGDHKIPESQGDVFKLSLSARGQVKTKRYSILLSHKTKKKKGNLHIYVKPKAGTRESY